jgi:aspartyl-tRNA(Asn)/glutamyl-tRNA(Gln) amidotransferase subunit C
MQVTIETVERIAKLARLSLRDDEKEKFTEQFNTILSYIEKLNELDTEGVEPLSQLVTHANALRTDETKPCLPVEDALKNTPSRMENFIKVPKVIG